MSRRRGVLALWMILAFAGLLTVLTGLLYGAVYRERADLSYEQGIAAAYAAESGAVWALAYLQSGELPEGRFEREISAGEGTSCAVRIEKTGENGAFWQGTVKTRGLHASSGTLRYLQLTVSAEGEAPRTVKVEDLQKWKWQ